MKKFKLLALPLLSLALVSCGEQQESHEEGKIDDIIPQEFDFANFSRETVLTVLDNLQHSAGFEINFKFSHYDDVNAEPTIVSDVTIGGKDCYTWAIETTNNVTYGAATKVTGDQFICYVLNNGVWSLTDEITYKAEDAANFVSKKVDQLVVKEEYLSKIDFSKKTGTTSICSRSCYTFSYSGDYYLSIAVEKYIGIIMSFSVTTTDNVAKKALRDCVEVQSFALNNVEVPAFPES